MEYLDMNHRVLDRTPAGGGAARAALGQRLRGIFGAHTYRRVDRQGVFDTLWSQDRTEREA